MTPQELRASILQQAIQGKLVEQRFEDGTGEELFQYIQTEKIGLIRAGKIKKEKPMPEIMDDELPFSIPETWKWVRIGQIFDLQAGKNITAADIFESQTDAHKYLCYGGNGVRGYVTSFNREGHYSLIGRQGALCGNINLAQGQFYATEHAVVVDHFNICDVLWSAYFLEALNLNQYATATAQPGLSVANVVKVLIPLPPVAEQKRIVAKLEEILPLIDRYKEAWNKLEEFNKRFPSDMQKSILQLAIQGKLAEQCPEEGTGEELFQQIQAEKQALIKAGKIKKEKPLSEIAENEIPFDIPESWKWVRLRSLGVFSSGKTPTMGIVENWDNGTVSWITSKDMKKKYLSSSEMLITEKAASEMKVYPENTVLMVVRSGILKRLLPVAILTGESTINQDVKALSLHMSGISEFVYVILKGMETHILKEYRKQVTTVDSLRFEDFQNMPVPLPPLAEQNRIVAKLEEILPLCERLK